jgi:ATP-dependent Lhr-like helicase
MSLEKRWDVDEAYDLVRRSYPFHELTKKDFLAVLDYLSSRNPDIKVFAKIWFDEEEARFGKKKGTRMIYYTNVGTIPEEGTYHVFSERGSPLGELSEKFVEYLSPNDIFVLGGRTYSFVRARGTSVYVKDASGRRPTVPSWTGEMLPRSFDLSIAVGEFRRDLSAKIKKDGAAAAKEWLKEEYRTDAGSAQSLVSYVEEQEALIPDLPTDRRVLLEGYLDVKGNRNVIFHFPFGRRVNDALSRAYAFALTEAYHTNVRVSVTDDNFMITVPKRIEMKGLVNLVTSENLEDLLRRAIRNTELFKQRFRHCATRSFMILRNYKGREVSIGRQQLRSQRVLDWLHEIVDFPVVKETYNEILHEVMDLSHAREVLGHIESGQITVAESDFASLPSPFAHNVVLQGVSDLVLMEDRSALLRELHRKVLERVMPADQISSIQFQPGEIAEYFRRKVPKVARKEDILSYLDRVGDANLLQQKGRNVFDVGTASFSDLRKWAGQLMDEGVIESVWTPQGIHWATKDHVPNYVAVYSQRSRLKPPEEKALALLKEKPRTHTELARTTKWKKDTLNEVLRKLERSYLVARRGVEETVYVAREPVRAPFEGALDKVLTRRLEVDGPTSATELAVALGLEPDLVEEVLRGLESEGVVSSGHFLVDEEFQFMLTRDLQRLQRKGETREVFDETPIKAFLLEKQFRRIETIDDYFDTFLEAGMVLDVWNHTSRFDYKEWLRRRASGDILEGRFLNGRVRYIRAADVPLFLSAFPRSPLTELESKVLEAIRASDGIDIWGITSKVHEEKERVKEALDKLDYDVYVIRKFQGDGWTARNLYVAFDPPAKELKDAMETLVKRFLGAYGPVPFSGIREWARFEWDDLERLVDRLEEQGIVTRILVTGKAESEMYVLAKDLPALRQASSQAVADPVRVLSLLDPWAQPLWAQVASRYGEGWFFPLVKDGDLVGMAEIWEMSGCIEVRELDLSSPDLLPEAVDALKRMMSFYTLRGVDVLRVTRFQGKDVPEAEDLSPWTQAGFIQFSDFVAHGPIVTRDFDRRDLLAYTLHKQGIATDARFADSVAAAKALGGLRSDFAARLRVQEFRPLERLHRSGVLAKGLGIPEYWTYCSEDDLGLFKAAKGTRLTKDMKAVHRLIVEEGPISRVRLLLLSDLSRPTTAAALRKLYEGLHVTRDADNRYRAVPDVKISRDDARRDVLRRIIRSLGVTSAESLAAFTRFEYNMGETRQRLREFEREGWLAKGFLARGERTVLWVLREDLDRIGTLDARRKFVLTPQDNLFLYLREAIVAKFHMGHGYVVFDGPEMVAAFKARRRKWQLMVTEFQGDASARRIVEAWEAENELAVEEEVERISDHEVMEWYAKMYGRGAAEK